MAGIKLSIQQAASDNTLSEPERQTLMSRKIAEYRGKHGELATDMFESHALAAGVNPERLSLIQEVKGLQKSLMDAGRDPNLTDEERHTVIDMHADALRQQAEELRNLSDKPQSSFSDMLNHLSNAPKAALEKMMAGSTPAAQPADGAQPAATEPFMF